MQSTQPLSGNAPVVLIVSRDRGVGALGEALWSAGLDYVTVASWAEVRNALEAGTSVSAAIVDGDLPALELEQVMLEMPKLELKGVLWLVSANGEGSEDNHLPSNDRGWERVFKPLTPAEGVRRIKLALGTATPMSDAGSVDPLPEPGQIIAVFSNKGGVGKSTIAINLAVGLRRLYADRVLLVDADLHYGDLEPLLDALGRHSVLDVCVRQGREPESLVALTTGHNSGISFLPRPPEMSRVETLDMSVLVQALPVYATRFNHVVVNMSSTLDEFNLGILDVAHQIVVVTTPEMASAVNTARFIEVATRMKLARKILVVLNRAGSGVSADTLKEKLALKFAAQVPSAGRVIVQAADAGQSLFVSDPHERHEITRAMRRLVEVIAGRPPPARRASVLSRILGRAA